MKSLRSWTAASFGKGELVFAVNDDLLVDNSGSFTVTVSYSCWPGWGYGDENHTHCGPPGLAGKDVPSSANAPSEKGPNGAGPNGNGRSNGSSADAPNGNGNGNANGRTADAPNGNGKGNGLAKH